MKEGIYMALYESVAQTFGNTPLVRIKNFEKENGLAPQQKKDERKIDRSESMTY